MTRAKYDPVELTSSGKLYHKMTSIDMSMMPEDPVLNLPISPRENWKLLFEGKKPYWLPFIGRAQSENDVTGIRPRLIPDNVANHQVFDGGPLFSYEGYGDTIRSSWFDLDWVWIANVNGATMYPGNPKVLDITKWEEYVSIPNLDELDWDSLEKQNIEYLDSNRLRQFGIQCGLFERLMALMDVAEACIALIDEDQKPGVHRFFDKYANFLIDLIGRVADRCKIDNVLIHEDWAHQNGPFMSPAVASEMLVPYTKRIVDYCHSRGLSYEIHCCGACEKLIPAFIETGADFWTGQPELNDMLAFARKHKGCHLALGVFVPDPPLDASLEDVRKMAREWVDECKDYKVFCSMRRSAFDRSPFHSELRKAIYEYSRIAYQNED